MTLDLTFLLFAVPAVLLAGLGKGGMGDIGAFLATPLVAIAAGPAGAIGFMLPLLMVMDIGAVRAYWGRWDGPSVRLLLLSALPGVALGALFYRLTDPALLGLALGLMALAFLLWKALLALGLLRLGRQFGPGVAVAAGVAAGFTSFVAHAGGPPVSVYLLGRGLSKTAYQATAVAVFWGINLAKAVPYAFLGIFTADSLTASAALLPVALLGVWLGIKAHGRIPERLFFGATYLTLGAAALKLIADGIG